MNDKQSKALCSLLTIILVLLFVMVLYRVFQSLERIEENMQASVINVQPTESGLNATLNNFLYDETVSQRTKNDRAEYKKRCEENEKKYKLGNKCDIEPFALKEQEDFHGNMINKLEPFTSTDPKEQLQTKIDAIQKLLYEIENKTYMSSQSVGVAYKATVSFETGNNVKKVDILLQEYSIEGNPTKLFVIPETVGNKYSLMCVETVKETDTSTNSSTTNLEIKLSKCKFFDSLDNTKPFLFKLEEVKNNDDNVISRKIRPFIDNEEKYSLGVTLSDSAHTLELLSEDPASNSNSKNVFQITKV